MSRRAQRSGSVRHRTRFLTVFVAAIAVVIGTVAPLESATASAAMSASTSLARSTGDVAQTGMVKTSLAGFNPGNIISDAMFTNSGTMTEAQIQSFLNGKVAKCVVGKDEDGLPFVCLKDLKVPTQSKAADMYCSAYAGASSEPAARILYKVARACNINPQVLIVMLQKEQGLVNHVWPSNWRYNKAMGQACPDTAPCDTAFAGFFAQVYGAARQMQIYMEGKYFQWYKAGRTWPVLYHPNASCGTAPVYIANKATEALYYYTPYQPNAAALKAGYGTGDGCSSYGNRNFYNYFTDWFGSTQTPAITPTGAIATEWKRMGGASGALGKPAAVVQAVTDPNGNGFAQKFAGGWIHSSAAGTFSSLTPIMTAYSAAGWLRGSLGWPLSQTACANGSCTQLFDGGIISYASGKPATTTLGLTERSLYAASPGLSTVGAMVGELQVVGDPNGGGLAQKYQNGWMHASSSGAFWSSTGIMTGYSRAGWLRGFLGWPIKAEQIVSDPNGNGVAQEFQGGWVHSSTAGTFSSSTEMMKAYSAAGWVRGQLGWPTSDEACTGQACAQAFTKGVIGYVKGQGAVTKIGVTPAAMKTAATQQVNVTKSLGAAQAPLQVIADPNGSGLAQKFANGWVHSSDKGTFVSSTSVMTAYSSAGWLRGTLGWPTGIETCSGTLCSQPFEGGTIAYSPGKPAVALHGIAAQAFATLRSPQATGIGAAAAGVQVVKDPNGNGLARKYAAGWLHASDRGTFSSSLRIMTGYSAAGWLRGSLGWPVKAEQTVTDPKGNGVAQEFEGGWIHSSNAGTYASSSKIMAGYSAAGWVRGDLGWPVKAEQVVTDRNGNGVAQSFQGGWVHSSAAGTFASSSTVMKAYSAAGWLRGKLGWPTGAETCSGTTCSQTFTGGTISYSPGKPAVTTFK